MHPHALADQVEQLRDQRHDDRTEHPDDAVARRHREEDRQAGVGQQRREADQPAEAHQRQHVPRGQLAAAEIKQRVGADQAQPGDQSGDGQEHAQTEGQPDRGEHLAGEHLLKAARAGEDRLPRALPVLAREHVAGQDPGHDRKAPVGREAQDHQRDRVTRGVNPHPEQGVAGGPALDLEQDGEDQRAEHRDDGQDPERQLRDQLAPLGASGRDHAMKPHFLTAPSPRAWPSIHARGLGGTSSTVTEKNRLSSGLTSSSSPRTASPAPTTARM